MDKPIEIGRLQRFATDFVAREGRQVFRAGAPTGKRVGVVGSGPAGLSCATYLARMGHEVTIYERREMAGGLDTYGMAEYKMTQRVSTDEAAQVERLGVRFRLSTEVGRDISVGELESAHDGVFLGTGLGETGRLDIPGEGLEGVYDALHVIERIKSRRWETVPVGRAVAVIGAGNTAIDAVTQARRLGAERVLLVYRRTQREMSAFEYEFELAKQDAVEFWWQTAPVAVLADESGGRVAALRCARTELSEADERGRRTAQLVAGSEFDIPVDLVIKATGQEKLRDWLTGEAKVDCDAAGRVVVNPETMQTSNAKIFAGGDCVNGGREAVDAAQMGKLAAQGIHEKLTGERVEFAGARVELHESTGQTHAS
jgi:glutamate synthase (NADPH/NADH) small chain